jgi:2Fe-2S ferredoxin
MFKVTCHGLNRTFELEENESLFFYLKNNDFPIASSCLGEGVCKWCKIKLLNGQENLSEPTKMEIKANLKGGERLCCQIKIYGPIEITTTYW